MEYANVGRQEPKLAQDTNITLFVEGCVTTAENRTLINFGSDPSWQTLTALAKDDAAGWFAVEWGSAEVSPEDASEAAAAAAKRAPTGDEVRHGGRAVSQDTLSSPVSETLVPITIEVLLHCMLYFCVLRQSDRRTLQ